MIISMIAAGPYGAIIPMILTAFGRDPQSSSIILFDDSGRYGIFQSLADRDDAGERAFNLIEKFYAYAYGHIPGSV